MAILVAFWNAAFWKVVIRRTLLDVKIMFVVLPVNISTDVISSLFDHVGKAGKDQEELIDTYSDMVQHLG